MGSYKQTPHIEPVFSVRRNDCTQRTIVQYSGDLQRAMKLVHLHAVNACVGAQVELPDWVVGSFNSTIYITGNRSLLLLANAECCIAEMSYLDFEMIFKIVAFTALKRSAWKQDQSAFRKVIGFLSYATAVEFKRAGFPEIVADCEEAEIYNYLSGTGRVFLPIVSSYQLAQAVESEELILPLDGRAWVLEMALSLRLLHEACQLARNP